MSLLGGGLVVCAFWLLGRLLAAEEKQKLLALEGLISFFRYTGRRISVFRAPLGEIFAGFENRFLEQKGFLQALHFGSGSVGERFGRGLELLPLESELRAELRLFASELGQLTLSEQEARLNACLSLLESGLERLKSAVPAKQKSIKAVCTLAGAMVAIIML